MELPSESFSCLGRYSTFRLRKRRMNLGRLQRWRVHVTLEGGFRKETSVMTKRDESTIQGAYLILGRPEVVGLIEVGRRYDLKSEGTLLSNQKDSEVPIPSSAENDYRVLITRDEEGWIFENLGKKGSVFVNQFPSEEHRLTDGDLLRVGQTVFHFLEGIGILSDIYSQMSQATRIDLQTGAYNKAHFQVALEDWMTLTKRHRQTLSLLMIDIDHFKRVNDTYGHLAGDLVLKQLSDRILKRVRKGDVFCRVGGGEEFALILPETSKESAIKFAEELRQEIERAPFNYEQISLPVTVSIGVAEYVDGMTKDEFIQAADTLMYQAKNAGRNRVVG